jgi:ABC-2 type transport system ATP-binding protein
MIEVKNLTKRYGDKVAVDNLTFAVRPGSVTGFLGPNGSGKSTTMRVILGLDRPTEGLAMVDGLPYARHRAPLRSVGALLDASEVHPRRTAYAHLLSLAATIGSGRARVHEVLDNVGLNEVMHRRVGTYSLGMKQRLGIAVALLGDPGVIILDEPVNGLDPDGVVWIRRLLRSLAAEGRTILVSSHLMSEMAQTADHLVIVGRGRLLADVPTSELLATSKPRVVLQTQHAAQLAPLLAEVGAVVEQCDGDRIEVTGIDTHSVARLALEQRFPLYELGAQSTSLEQAFMEITQGDLEYLGAESAQLTGRAAS